LRNQTRAVERAGGRVGQCPIRFACPFVPFTVQLLHRTKRSLSVANNGGARPGPGATATTTMPALLQKQRLHHDPGCGSSGHVDSRLDLVSSSMSCELFRLRARTVAGRRLPPSASESVSFFAFHATLGSIPSVSLGTFLARRLRHRLSASLVMRPAPQSGMNPTNR
jgi:hypothetical protein